MDPLIQSEIEQGITKTCPSCGIYTTKNEGCNYLRCICNAEWCWICEKIKGPNDNNCPFGNPTHNSH